MTLRERLQRYGQFSHADLPALANIVVLAEDVARHRMELDECNCGEPCEGNCCYADAARLHGMIDTLVEEAQEATVGNIDDLWNQVNWAHGRHDEGEIDEATAKAECDAAIAGYLGYNQSDLLPKTGNVISSIKGDIDIHEAFVTMTVPVSIAMRVADNELGDDHYNAVMNLEMMLVQDLEEEYGITTELAQAYHQKIDQEVK